MRIGITLLLLICSQSVYSQINGVVRGTQSEIVEFATVLLLSPTDSSIVKYTITDTQGKFSIDGNIKGEYLLQVRNMAYLTKDTLVVLPSNFPIVIVLSENLLSLDDVVVVGTSSGMRWSSDTLKYDVKKFSDGNERLLSELLNKLPGIDVDSKGVTRVQGKEVDKFLVNGNDVFGSNSQLAVKNISADMVENVEVVNNYSEYSILGGFRTYDKTAINIGIDKNRSKSIIGDVMLSGGYDTKHLSRLNLMRLRGKSMLSVIGSMNNIGEEVFSIDEYIKLQGGIGDIFGNSTASLSLSNAEIDMLMPPKDVYKRNAGIASLNWAYNPSPKFGLNTSFLSNFNNSDAFSQRYYTYYLPQGKTYQSHDISERQMKNMFNSGFFKVEYKPSPSLLVVYKSNPNFSNYQKNERSTNDKINNNSDGNYETLGINQSLTIIKRFNDNILSGQLQSNSSRSDSYYNYLTDSLLIPVPYIMTDTLYRVTQKGRQSKLNMSADISYLHRLNKDFFIQTSLKGDFLSQKFGNHIYEHENYTEQSYFNHYSISTELVRNKGLLQFRVGGVLHSTELNNLFISPKAELTLFFSRKNNLRLSYWQSVIPTSLEDMAATSIIENYQLYRVGSYIDKKYSLRHNASLFYTYYRGYSGTLFFASAGYIIDSDATTKDYSSDGIMSSYYNIISPLKRGYYSRLGLNQRIIPSLNLRANVSWDRNEQHNIVNNTPNSTLSNRVKANIDFISNYKSMFNFELGVLTEQNIYSHNSGSIIQRIYGVKGKTKLAPFDRIHVEFLGQLSENQALTRETIFDLGFIFKYEVKKNVLDIELWGQNIMNITDFQWNKVIDNGLYSVNEYNMQIPGNIRIAVKYKF